jgi:hypothetical protein
MSDRRNDTASCSFVLTPCGYEAANWVEVCSCRLHFVGGMIECRDCGTIYGTLGDMVKEGRVKRGYGLKSARS